MTLRSVSEVENDTDCVDKPPNSYHVTFFDIGAIIYAIIFHFVDVGFDIFLAYSYFIAEQYSYFAWTVAFTAIPSVVITSISLRMYFDDAQENLLSRNFWIRPALCVAGLGLQLAPIIRFVLSLTFCYYVLRKILYNVLCLQYLLLHSNCMRMYEILYGYKIISMMSILLKCGAAFANTNKKAKGVL